MLHWMPEQQKSPGIECPVMRLPSESYPFPSITTSGRWWQTITPALHLTTFASLYGIGLQVGMEQAAGVVDLRPFKEKLRARLPANSPILSDLLQEPDAMPPDRAAVLVPHYLRRLERELEIHARQGPPVLRA